MSLGSVIQLEAVHLPFVHICIRLTKRSFVRSFVSSFVHTPIYLKANYLSKKNQLSIFPSACKQMSKNFGSACVGAIEFSGIISLLCSRKVAAGDIEHDRSSTCLSTLPISSNRCKKSLLELTCLTTNSKGCASSTHLLPWAKLASLILPDQLCSLYYKLRELLSGEDKVGWHFTE